MVQSIVIMITKAPYGHEDVHSGLNIALACLGEDVRVTVVLINDGVYSAFRKQMSEETLGYPSVEDLLYALFPEGKVFAERASLKERGLQEEDLVETVETISEEDLLKIICECGEATLIF